MKNKRKPALAGDDYSELEARVDELMSTEPDRLPKKRRSDADYVVNKPNLPMDDKELSIKIVGRENSKPMKPPKKEPQPIDDEPKIEVTKNPTETQKLTSTSPANVESEEVDDAVDDIVTQEADKAATKAEASQSASVSRPNILDRLKAGCRKWWQTPKKRNATIAGLVFLSAVLVVVPTTRYGILNAFGVRVSSSLTVVDNSTRQPLRNVEVRIGDEVANTNEDGFVRLQNLRLGRQDLQIDRRAFAERNIKVTLGWGSNPLGEYWLYPTGAQYVFVIDDYVGGVPIAKAEVISDDVSAFSDEEGLARLTLDIDLEATEIDVEIQATGYRTEQMSIDITNDQQQAIQLVPALKHFYVSEQTEAKDVMTAYIDGKEEQVALSATGSEREDIVLLPHPNKQRVAIVSTRDDLRNEDDFLLSTLTIVDLADDAVVSVASSERIQLIDWYDEQIVFVQIASGASGANPRRQRIISYNYLLEQETELAASNYFNAVSSVNDYVYFAPSSIFQLDSTSLYRIRANGTSEEAVIGRESWSLYRQSYGEFTIATSDKWLTYDIFSGERNELDEQPEELFSRLYVVNPWDETKHAWIDRSDGTGELYVYNTEDDADEPIFQGSGLRYPLRWLNESTLVFRVDSEAEIADYAISAESGSPIKIRDVAKTAGLERWFSY